MARRKSVRTEPGVDEDVVDDEDEFAWQPKKTGKKPATGKKKRPTGKKGGSARSSSEGKSSEGKSEGKKSRTSATGKRPRGASGKTSSEKGSTRSARESGKLSSSSASRRRSSSGDDDPSASGRRRGRSGRPPAARKKQAVSPVVVISLITGTLLICAIIIVAANSGPKKIVDNQPARLEEAGKVASDGMAAFRAWNKARDDNNASLEQQKWKEAHQKLQQAVDMYNGVLDPYRDGEGYLPKDYEGYESELQEISKHLVDLEKSGRVR